MKGIAGGGFSINGMKREMISKLSNMGKTCLAGCLVLCLNTTVSAQTEPSIQPITSFTAVNADNCETELSQSFNLQAEHTGSTLDNHTLKIVFFTDSRDCLTNVSECPETYLDDSASEACGCIESFSVNNQSGPVSTSVDLSENDGLVPFLCAASQTLTFSVSVQLDAEGTEPVYTQNPVNLTIDVDAPDTPTIAPTLGSGEESLLVSLSNRDELGDDVDAHEICFAIRGSIQPPVDCSITDDLSPEEKELRLYCGFSASENCRQTDALLNGDFRLSGLQNDAEYEVIVAALDDAGNRSANSPSSTGRPADFIDFAEGYSGLFSDGSMGETGGCSSSQGEHHFWVIGLLLLCGVRSQRW